MHAHHIVVDDPTGDYREGSIVDPARAHQLRARGVALLPFQPDLARACGVGGYMRRGWGAGWPLDSATPRMQCPLTVYATPAYAAVHWAARLVASPQDLERARALGEAPCFEGLLRLAPDPSQPIATLAGAARVSAPLDVRGLGAPDAAGGWTVHGHGEVRFPMEGVYGFAIYGCAPGLRVAWAAMSATPQVDR